MAIIHSTGLTLVVMVIGAIAANEISITIDLNKPCSTLDKFWTHTGFSPISSSYEAAQELLLSKDEKINLAFISALPKGGITHVRVHWLLNLVSKRALGYDWKLMDDLLDWIVSLKLHLIFEIMGFPNGEPPTADFKWNGFCNQLADHLLERYGSQIINSWIFELWNEPDLLQYNILNFTLPKYLDYVVSCLGGVRKAIPTAIIGGPAGLFKFKNHELCWGFLEHCNSFPDKCNVDFLSFHKKAFPFDLLRESNNVVETIKTNYPSLPTSQFFNSESDLMSGWWKPQRWRGDVYYAAAVVKIVDLFRSNVRQDIAMQISNDNGFLNTHPHFFSQRTLLTRFNGSSNHRQFFRKPVYIASGILGLLERQLISDNTLMNSSFSFLSSIDQCENSSSSTIILINFVNGTEGEVWNRQHFEIIFPRSWGSARYSLHVLSNDLDHPRHVWEMHGKMDFPSTEIRALMRKAEGPHLLLRGRSKKQLKLNWEFPSPSVGLLRICTERVGRPNRIYGLKAINITFNEVLLFWQDDEARCVLSYEVEHCSSSSNDVDCRRVNNDDIIFCSFQYVNYEGFNEEHVRGWYRVRALNLWNLPGPYSQLYRYPQTNI